MSDYIYTWNQLYAQVPRPGPVVPWLLSALSAVGCVASTCLVVVALTHPQWQSWLPWWEPFFTFTAMLAASVLLVATAALLVVSHRRHTWVWGDAKLARLIWSSETDVDAVGFAILLAPLNMLTQGLGSLLAAQRSSATILAELVVDERLVSVRFRTNIHPELGQIGYGWIIQARLWPRRWYHLATVIPGGGASIMIPAEAMIELQSKLSALRGMQRSVPAKTRSLNEAPKLPRGSGKT